MMRKGLVGLLLLVSVGPALAAQSTLIPLDATWKYLDNGTDQGTPWRAPSFDDGAWASGAAELGYGDGDESTLVSFGPDGGNKFITTYFRRAFQVTGAATYSSLLLRLRRDDGAVVYLNGTEAVRSNMPAGVVTSGTLATSAIGGSDEITLLDLSLSPALLVEGSNVIAVEIHQSGGSSSDISFAAELIASDASVQIMRGPYLQSGSDTSVTVRWRASGTSDSRVWYGLSPTSLSSTADGTTGTNEHAVVISGLSPDTRYYYAVGTTAAQLVGGDAEHFFVTAPALGARKDVRIWAIGDAGTANNQQRAVRDAYAAVAGSKMPHLWMMLGDNAYNSGTDNEFESAVFDMYTRELPASVLWPTLGNHDGGSADSATESGPYYDIFTLPRLGEAGGEPSGTEAYYAFDYGNIHFICLESYETDRSAMGTMMTWLEADLQGVTMRPTPPDWIIAFWHHPPYTKGSHNSDAEIELIEMRQNALPILEDYGVDLVLTGHSHSYERSFLLDGHYGASGTLSGAMILNGGDGDSAGNGAYEKATLPAAGHEGAVYVVAGSSGQTSGGPLDHPAMFTSLNTLGSLLLDVDRNVLDARFLDDTASVLDSFRIVKGGPAQLPLDLCPPAPRGGCHVPTRARVALRQGTTDDRDRLSFNWSRGDATLEELGNPVENTDYALCIYDNDGVLIDMDVPSNQTAWEAKGTRGFVYRDRNGTAEGATSLRLSASTSGRATMSVRGKGTGLPEPMLPATFPVTAQLVNGDTGVCFTATFATATTSDGVQLRAKTP